MEEALRALRESESLVTVKSVHPSPDKPPVHVAMPNVRAVAEMIAQKLGADPKVVLSELTDPEHIQEIPRAVEVFYEGLQKSPYHVLKNGWFGGSALADLADSYATQVLDLARLKHLNEAINDSVVRIESGEIVSAGDKPFHVVVEELGLDPVRVARNYAKKVLELDNITKDGLKALMRELYFPDEAARSIVRLGTYVYNPETTGWFAKTFDTINKMWKTGVTALGGYPAFQIRNLLSGQWYNFVTAYDSFSQASRALKKAFDMVSGKDPETLEYLKQMGVLQGLQVDDLINTIGETSSIGVPKPGDVLNPFKAIKDAYKRTVELAREGIRESEFAMPVGVGNLRKIAGQAFGAAKRVIGGKNVPGSYPWGGLGAMGAETNKLFEVINRASHYYAQLENGMSPAQAARSTIMTHFDYGDLNRFEKEYLRRVFGFYSWMRKNIPAVLRQLATYPGGRIAQTIRLMHVMRNKSGGSSKDPKDMFIPEWLGGGFLTRLRSDDPRFVKYFSEYGLLPISDLNLIRLRGSGFPIDIMETAENLLARTTPPIQGPLQALTGRQFWSHRRLEDLYQSPFDDPNINLAFAQSPFSRAFSRASQLLDPRKTIPEKFVNFLIGGIKVTDVDVAKSLNLQMRDALQEILKSRKGVKEFRRLYVRDAEKIDKKTEELMAVYKALLKQFQQIKELEKQEQLVEN